MGLVMRSLESWYPCHPCVTTRGRGDFLNGLKHDGPKKAYDKNGEHGVVSIGFLDVFFLQYVVPWKSGFPSFKFHVVRTHGGKKNHTFVKLYTPTSARSRTTGTLHVFGHARLWR